jgi:uncharacterized protein YecE (DUF72 family)
MKVGRVDEPGAVDFDCPSDPPDTATAMVAEGVRSPKVEAYVGCAAWDKRKLTNFYPPHETDCLPYYSSQFNSIEFNATFYRLFPPAAFAKWYAATPAHFRFFPKLEQTISHFRRLNNVEDLVEHNVANMSHLKEKLRMAFLELRDDFAPTQQNIDNLVKFIQNWPFHVPLAVEFRHTAWVNDNSVAEPIYEVMEKHRVTNIIIDTAGRRDLMHMRLTTPRAFIRWVGTGDRDIDHRRLNDWVERIAQWKEMGLQGVYYFVHTHDHKNTPALAAYFIERLNRAIGSALWVPKLQPTAITDSR